MVFRLQYFRFYSLTANYAKPHFRGEAFGLTFVMLSHSFRHGKTIRDLICINIPYQTKYVWYCGMLKNRFYLGLS